MPGLLPLSISRKLSDLSAALLMASRLCFWGPQPLAEGSVNPVSSGRLICHSCHPGPVGVLHDSPKVYKEGPSTVQG
jgi:hypothetical protein